MQIRRAIAVVSLALGFALGSAINVSLATEQALTKPCPMQHQGGDCPCCKGDCTGAMMSCPVKCSVPFGAVALPEHLPLVQIAAKQLTGWESEFYNPFLTGPPPPIPIV